ncbi:MAG TPA: lysophospholipid acyltransferase family protein [Candidatus Xenobia bacterium]|jgi:1-acyl-sn-glycerol-3-phosphate acyltransferase
MLRFVTRGLLLLAWFLGTSAWAIVYSVLRWGNTSNGHAYGNALGWGATRALGVRLDIRGAEHLECQPCIYVANHQSIMDLLFFGALYPGRTVIVGKKEVLLIPFFGLWFLAAGNILLDRAHHGKAVRSMASAGERVKREGVSVWVFPEGHRNPHGPTMLPFKKGAFHLACAAGVPVVPVVAEYYHHAIDMGKLRAPGGAVHIRVLEPVASEGHDAESLMGIVRPRMEQALRQMPSPPDSALARVN